MKKKSLFLLAFTLLMIPALAACEKRAVKATKEDIISTVMTCMPYLIIVGIALIIMIVILVLTRKWTPPVKFMARTQAVLGCILAVVISINLICFGPVFGMLTLMLGDRQTVSEATLNEGREMCEEIMGEGIVLLKNADNALPLNSDVKNLNVFGWASVEPFFGGTGSGAVNPEKCIGLLEGLAAGGYITNSELSDLYTDYHVGRPLSSWDGISDWTLSEPAVDSYTPKLLASAKEFSDTALLVIGRTGGENCDLPTDMSTVSFNTTDPGQGHEGDFLPGEHYLELTATEEDMVELVCNNFKRVIVILNSANPMELGWVDRYEQIDGVVWCPGPGETGFKALGKVLSGEINPSGRLPDTFVYDLTKTPTFNNCGNNVYENSAQFLKADQTATFVNYVEGVYLGYKYYETAHVEGTIDYDAVVQYPFGYGLSYTSFDQSIRSFRADGKTVTLEVTVTNTGDVAGKDVVEVYATPPYYNGGIEKSAVNLVEFSKTGLLAPGASETVTITVDYHDLASYDALNNGCYVLEHGSYEISIRADSHVVLDSKSFQVDKDIVYKETHDGARPGDETTATNKFDFARGDVTYLSRKDGFANYDEVTAKPNTVLNEEYWSGAYNTLNADPSKLNKADDVAPTVGVRGGLKVADVVGLAYEDPKWERLLDQLTVKEMTSLIAYGGYFTMAIPSIGLPATDECDGPAVMYSDYNPACRGSAFPAAIVLAATWNKELAERRGELMGRQADEMDASGWYGPAMNIHRTAFSGRNFEYYSEDGVLSGHMGASEVRGAGKHGLLAYIKHFALNDQETNRKGVFTWSGEQAIREIYLKPFELSVKKGSAMACMSSYNCIGTQWSASSEILCNDILRDEWGFRGVVVTDWFSGGGMQDADVVIRGGSDRMLSQTGGYAILDDTTSATSLKAMRNSAHNIIYAIANSRTFYPENIKAGLDTWVYVFIGCNVAVGVILLAAEVLTIRKFKKKSEDAQAAHTE